MCLGVNNASPKDIGVGVKTMHLIKNMRLGENNAFGEKIHRSGDKTMLWQKLSRSGGKSRIISNLAPIMNMEKFLRKT